MTSGLSCQQKDQIFPRFRQKKIVQVAVISTEVNYSQNRYFSHSWSQWGEGGGYICPHNISIMFTMKSRPGLSVWFPFCPRSSLFCSFVQAALQQKQRPRRLQREAQRRSRKTTLIGSPIQPTQTAQEKWPTFRCTRKIKESGRRPACARGSGAFTRSSSPPWLPLSEQ